MFSSEHIKNKVLIIITCENQSSRYHFESKFQARISLSDQSFENQEKELIEFKLKHQDELRNLSSGPIKN